MSVDVRNVQTESNDLPPWNVAEEFQRLCDVLLKNRSVWSRNDYEHGGRRHTLMEDPKADHAAAMGMTIQFSSQEIADLLAFGKEQSIRSTRELHMYRSGMKRVIRACRSLFFRLLAPYSGWGEIDLMMDDTIERDVQLKPQIISLLLKMLDRTEEMFKEHWIDPKESSISPQP